MRIDDDAEKALSTARARKRQKMDPPLLVREDGVLCPNVPLIAKKPNFRPYHGPTKPAPSREELIAYYQGASRGQKRAIVGFAPQEPFDLGKADADAIVNFAMEEFGAALDPRTPINELRMQCYRLSQGEAISAPQEMAPRFGLGLGVEEDVPGVGDITAPPKPPADETTPRRGPGRPRRNATAEV